MENSDKMLCHQKIVSIDHISFSYENKTVINNLQFNVLERDFVGVIGSNGAGKTTLLKMLVGLLKPTNGEIRLFDRPLNQFKDWERIGYVPQKNAFNPLFPATVREVVLSGMYNKKNVYRRLSKAELQKAEDAMLAMRIEDLADRVSVSFQAVSSNELSWLVPSLTTRSCSSWMSLR